MILVDTISVSSPFGIFLTYIYLFIIGSFLGWCSETLFRRFVSMKRWINPGFLKGPCLPLYGFGVCVLYFISDLFFKYVVQEGTFPSYYNLAYIENTVPLGGLNFYWSAVIMVLVSTIVLTFVEFLAGVIFIKLLRIKLWDYSKMKGNIMGVICPLFTLLWGVIACLYFFLIHPLVNQMIVFFNSHVWGLTFFIGAYCAIFVLDFLSSLRLTFTLRKNAVVEKAVVDFEKFKLKIKEKPVKERRKLFFEDALKESLEPLKKKLEEVATEIKSHMYIDNKIPEKGNESETLTTIKENKENDKEE